ncbi:unnamed protein product [Oncorhynchus mykiss]|uniref:Uncharacterized protein n=1 Tax=Oncorhynchus mykiss TaxID=8022 RepID=A0A060YSC2_ONCMY|nr:unnamed protein product [Oncorhynchus mykiss]
MGGLLVFSNTFLHSKTCMYVTEVLSLLCTAYSLFHLVKAQLFIFISLLLLLVLTLLSSFSMQMSSYKRATFEEEATDNPADGSMSPDSVEVGFRKGGIQLLGPMGRRTQMEVVLAGVLLCSLLALFGCAVTLGMRYNTGEAFGYTHGHRRASTHTSTQVLCLIIRLIICYVSLCINISAGWCLAVSL